MRELRQLPREENASQPTAAVGSGGGNANWGPRQGLWLLGVLVLLAGSIPTLYKTMTLPAPQYRNEQELHDFANSQFDKMTLVDSWDVWKRVVENQGLSNKPSVYEAQYEEDLAHAVQWIMIFGTVAGLGVILIAAGFIVRP